MKGTLRLYTLLRMNTWPSRWCLGGLTTTPWHLSPTTGSSHAGVGPAHHRTVTTFEEVGRNISPYRRTVTTNKRSVKKKGNAVRSPSGEREAEYPPGLTEPFASKKRRADPGIRRRRHHHSPRRAATSSGFPPFSGWFPAETHARGRD